MADGPAPQVTFLLSDVQGSTRLWEEQPDQMGPALVRHDAIFDEVVARHGGTLVKSKGEGDSAFCTFDHPADAIAAALELQRRLDVEQWPTSRPIRVRMSVHTGPAALRDGDWYGTTVNRAARIRAIAHGGQVVVSAMAARLSGDRLPVGATLRDLGMRRLKDLSDPEHIFQLDHPGLAASHPPLLSLDVRPHNLPVQPTPLIGREDDVARLRSLLQRTEVRLVTLTGPGGMGKTRLALQAAADLVDSYTDGAHVVFLDTVERAEDVPSAIARALEIEVPPDGDTPQVVLERLADANALVVLDNFEHVLEAAEFVAELVSRCRAVKVLATSREHLHLRAEHEVVVDALAVPPADSTAGDTPLRSWPALALFLDRAEAAGRADIDEREVRTVAAIVRLLEGLPLAIELAAARTRELAPADLLAALDRRLDVLADGPRDLPKRQRTVRDTVAWSHDLLEDVDKMLFRRLAVFAGGWSTEAAVAVAGDGIDDVAARLASLAAKHLVRRVDDDRWSMLRPIADFAGEQLTEHDERTQAEDRHARLFLELAREAEVHSAGEQQATWFDRLALDHENLGHSLEVRAGTDVAVATAGSLIRYWTVRGHWAEARRHVDAAVASGAGTGADRSAALLAAGYLAELRSDHDEAKKLLLDSLELREKAGDEGGAAAVQHRLGAVADRSGDREAAIQWYGRSMDIRKRIGDERGTARLLVDLGVLAHNAGDLDDAQRHYEKAVPALRALGDRRELGTVLVNLAAVRLARGDLAGAEAPLDEAMTLYEQIGDSYGRLKVLDQLAGVLLAGGDVDAPMPMLEEASQLARELGAPAMLEAVLAKRTFFHVLRGEPEAAHVAALDRLDSARQLGDQDALVNALADLITCSDRVGRGDEAAAAAGEAFGIIADLETAVQLTDLEISTGAPGPRRAVGFLRCAHIARAAGDLAAAARFLGAAEAADPTMTDEGIAAETVAALGSRRAAEMSSIGAAAQTASAVASSG